MARSKRNGGGPGLASVSAEPRKRPNRAVLYAVEGWGKTSLACFLPNPIILMTRGEDGLRTLAANGRVPPTPHFDDEAETFNECVMAVNELAAKDHPYQTLVLDTINGAGRLCVDAVTQTAFGGDAAKFNDFGRGWKVVPQEWKRLLDALTRANEKGMSIMLLCHADVVRFNNPEGADYDRYTARMPKQLWEPTFEWADMVLFGQLETFVKTEGKDKDFGKAKGGQNRLLYCERTAVADAKNRHGLPPQISCGYGPEKAWDALIAAVAAGRAQAPAATTTPDTPNPKE